MKKILSIALTLALSFSLFAQSGMADRSVASNGFAPAKYYSSNVVKDGPSWSQIHTPFSTNDIYGNPIDVADTLAAGKAIVIDYSATWCNPCYRFHQSKNLEAIHNVLGDSVCVLWVESDNSTTLDDIYGTGSSTQGNWTQYSDGTPVGYPIIDCASCESMIDPTGYVPAVYFIAPSGYYCHIYGESWGFGINTSNANAIAAVRNLLTIMPQPGQAPVISSINMPSASTPGAAVNFSVDFVSIDEATVAWTFENATPATASSANATATWDQPGNYNVTVTVTNANGQATQSGVISIINYAYYFDFEDATQYTNWTKVDADGDGYNWTFDYLRGNGSGHDESQGMLASASWNSSTQSPLTPNNWIFTTAIDVPDEADVKFVWWEKGQDANYAAEHYGVYVATSPTVAAATSLNEYTATGVWKIHGVSLEAYRGQTVYMAMRHFGVTDMFYLDIDDMGVTTQEIVGIDRPGEVDVVVFPNPVSDKLNIVAEGLQQVVVLDLSGRVVTTANANEIDLSNLSAGLYVVRVITNSGIATQKFIKK